MTTTNFFGDTVFTPEDGPDDFTIWCEEKGLGEPDAAVIEADEEGLWYAEIQTKDAPGYAGNAKGFESAAAIRLWLVRAGVPKREIEMAEEA
jgi:hypothetical protein